MRPGFREDIISTRNMNLRDVSIETVLKARRLDLSGSKMGRLARVREIGKAGKL